MTSEDIGPIGHVLLVEHEAAAREATRHFLARAGFSVRAASQAAEAIRRLNDGERPAVVLADCDLPAIGGNELLRIINKRWGFIPVVLYSRAMRPELRAELIGEGADICFDKPLDVPKVVSFLRPVRIDGGRGPLAFPGHRRPPRGTPCLGCS